MAAKTNLISPQGAVRGSVALHGQFPLSGNVNLVLNEGLMARVLEY